MFKNINLPDAREREREREENMLLNMPNGGLPFFTGDEKVDSFNSG